MLNSVFPRGGEVQVWDTQSLRINDSFQAVCGCLNIMVYTPYLDVM